MTTTAATLAQRLEDSRWPDFWARSNHDRPLLHLRATEPDRFNEPEPRAELPQKERDLIPAWQRYRARKRLATEHFLGDAIPFLQIDWAHTLAALPVLAGGDYEYDANGNAWIKAIPDLYDRPLPTFDPEAPVARQLSECYDAIREEVGDRALVIPPLLLDGLTTLSLFRGAEELSFDLLEDPAPVHAWSEALTTMFIAIYNDFFDRLGQRWSVCFGGPAAPGRSDAVQCDFAVMLSPAHFQTFVAPNLARMSANFDHCLYHLDGVAQMRFLDQIQACPGVWGIQWNPEPTYAAPASRLEDLREIQRRGLCLMVECPTVDDALRIASCLDPAGLLLRLQPFPSREEAEAALAVLR